MKVEFACITALLLFFGLWLVGCDQANAPLSDLGSESILAAPSVAASWHQLSDAQRNQLILMEAQKWDEKPDGQNGNCKEWVRYVVKTVSAGASIIPQTDTNQEKYYQAQWILNSSDQYRPVSIWKMAYACPTYFPSTLKPGQIIQLRWGPGANPPSIIGQPHTTIIKSVSSTDMWWWDSNFVKPGIIGDHQLTLADWSRTIEARPILLDLRLRACLTERPNCFEAWVPLISCLSNLLIISYLTNSLEVIVINSCVIMFLCNLLVFCFNNACFFCLFSFQYL